MKSPRPRKEKVKALTMNRIALMIEQRVSFFNGWYVSEDQVREACEEAAKAIIAAWNRRGR